MKCERIKWRYGGLLLHLIKKQAQQAIFLRLTGQTGEAILGLDMTKLSCDQRVGI